MHHVRPIVVVMVVCVSVLLDYGHWPGRGLPYFLTQFLYSTCKDYALCAQVYSIVSNTGMISKMFESIAS